MLGVQVEVTSRAPYLWAICGAADAVHAAVKYVQDNGLMTLTAAIDHDDELDESFAYLDDRCPK